MQIIDRVSIILFQAKYVICVVEIVEIASFHLFPRLSDFPGLKNVYLLTSDENYHVIMICLQKMSLHHWALKTPDENSRKL